MKSRINTVSWAVVLMAACSLFSMIGTFQIDEIVNHDLYKYGLQFNYAWATPYWNAAGFVFGMGWFSIVVALIVNLRFLFLKRKASRQIASQAKKETTSIKPTEVKPTEVKPTEEQKEEKPTPVETQKETTEVQVFAVDTNEQKDEMQTEIASTPEVEPQSEQVEEQAEQAEQTSASPEDSETQQRETESETPEESEETPVLPGSMNP